MNDEPPVPVRLVDEIAYQSGAVVSRKLIQKPTGSITLFAFDAGEGLSEHTAPYDAFATILEGEAEIRIAGVPYQVRAGEMLRLPAGKPHALDARGPFKMHLVMIRS
jgi:quercetin dioxygenase-like cupin family protein